MDRMLITKYTGLLDNVIADYSLFDDGSVLFESYWKDKINISRVSTANYTNEDLLKFGYYDGISFIKDKGKKYPIFKETTRLSCYRFSLKNKVTTTEFAEKELNLKLSGVIDQMKRKNGRQLARVNNEGVTKWIDIRYLKHAC